MHHLALIILLAGAELGSPDAGQAEVLERLRRSLSGVSALTIAVPPPVQAPLSAPPLIEAEPVSPLEAEQARRVELSPSAPSARRAPLAVARPAATKPEPTYQVGLVAVGGAEGSWPAGGGQFALGLRIGGGLRYALLPREPGELTARAIPSVAVVAGYAGPVSDRFFAEVRAELVVAPPGGLFVPGFTIYALGGTDVLGVGGVDSYVGMGVGWDYNIFKGNGSTPAARSGGWGGGGWGGGGGGLGGLAILAGAAVAVVAIIGFICAGRVEIRYHPAPPHLAPANLSVLIGFGL